MPKKRCAPKALNLKNKTSGIPFGEGIEIYGNGKTLIRKNKRTLRM